MFRYPRYNSVCIALHCSVVPAAAQEDRRHLVTIAQFGTTVALALISLLSSLLALKNGVSLSNPKEEFLLELLKQEWVIQLSEPELGPNTKPPSEIDVALWDYTLLSTRRAQSQALQVLVQDICHKWFLWRENLPCAEMSICYMTNVDKNMVFLFFKFVHMTDVKKFGIFVQQFSLVAIDTFLGGDKLSPKYGHHQHRGLSRRS